MSEKLKPVRTYAVTVNGFDALLYSARSPGKARARCYGDYLNYDDRTTFRQFLSMSRVRLADNPPGIGERILVCGKPATRIIGRGSQIAIMYDDSDDIISAHHTEVAPYVEPRP